MYSNSLQSRSIQTPKSAVTSTSLVYKCKLFGQHKKPGAWFLSPCNSFFVYRWFNLSVWRWWKRCGMRIFLQSRPVAPPKKQPALIPQWPQHSHIPRICSNIQWETQWFHPPPPHHNGNQTHSFPSTSNPKHAQGGSLQRCMNDRTANRLQSET